MLEFRLKVFYTVAKRLSFTRAAGELFITQPAVTKHIRELESHYKATLFERSGNKRISLTSAGELLLQYAERLNAVYGELEFDMNQLVQQHSGVLRIGGSNTVAQYIIPKVLAQFRKKFGGVQVHLVTGNTEQMEQALLSSELDLGIVEGLHRNPQLHYDAYLQDELVLVCSTANKAVKSGTIKPEDLIHLPMLLREPGSGTLDVLENALKPHHIRIADLKTEMRLGGAESIKSYLDGSNCFAFLSVHAIMKELQYNECRIIDVDGLTIERPFYFVQRHGQLSPLAQLFKHFAAKYKL